MTGWWKRFDWLSLAVTLALIGIGTVAIRSAGCARAEVIFHGMWVNNLVTAGVGLVLYFVIAAFDYRKGFGLVVVPAYLVSLVLLVTVLLVGSEQFGGKRWLWFFQPSEVSKLCVISLVAVLFGDGASRLARLRSTFWGFLLAAVLVGVPAVLILAEPDLGTTLTLLPAVLVMLLVGGVWRRGLVTLVIAGAIAALVLLGAAYEAYRPGVSAERRERILKYIPLKSHQLKRVQVFLFPEQDQLGAGYNLREAKIAIGSGMLFGKGLFHGTQSQLNFLPENHTDFIFAVVGETHHLKYLPQAISMNDFIFCVYAEETGFVGTLVLLTLFGVLLVSGCWTAFRASDGVGRLLALGVTTLVFAHVYVNIAMSIGIVPITGLPLPFISSGRTFLIVVLCGLGLIQSVNVHREENKK